MSEFYDGVPILKLQRYYFGDLKFIRAENMHSYILIYMYTTIEQPPEGIILLTVTTLTLYVQNVCR